MLLGGLGLEALWRFGDDQGLRTSVQAHVDGSPRPSSASAPHKRLVPPTTASERSAMSGGGGGSGRKPRGGFVLLLLQRLELGLHIQQSALHVLNHAAVRIVLLEGHYLGNQISVLLKLFL